MKATDVSTEAPADTVSAETTEQAGQTVAETSDESGAAPANEAASPEGEATASATESEGQAEVSAAATEPTTEEPAVAEATEAEPVAVEPPPPSAFEDAVKQALTSGNKRQPKITLGSSEVVYHKSDIQAIYEKNGYKPLWGRENITSLLEAVDSLAEDGLNPDEYRLKAIAPYLGEQAAVPASLQEEAKFDILLTEAYLRAIYNLQYGKVDAFRLDKDHNYSKSRSMEDNSGKLLAWVKPANT